MASPIPDDPPVTNADFIVASLWIGASRDVSAAAEGAAAACQGEGEGVGSLRGQSSVLRRDVLPYSVSVETVGLTTLARAGGCAAKYSAARLETLLAGLVPADAEDLLVGLDPADDAAVYRLDDERAIVFTVDFFPPLVDDPRTFGAIAATNALNDVFAMGGAPLLALSVTAFPEELPVEVLGDVLAGADERVRAAGAILAGGHTIRDNEPKYGLAVVGLVHPARIWPKAGARAGDVLFLTKPLGTGLVLQARRDGIAPAGALEAAVESMIELNRAAADAIRSFEPSAVTDVTGFGLLGHTYELASRSGVRAVIDADALPSLPAALELAADGVRTGGDGRNREYAERHVESHAAAAWEALAYDPQTAGGLLVSMPGDRAAVLEATLTSQGLVAARIGRVEEGSGVLFR
jgi:selenide,water dikinase